MERKTAFLTGVLFVIATVEGLAGTSLTGPNLGAPDYLARVSSHANQVVAGALLAFIAAASSAGIAIALYPVLKKHNEGLALGAVAFRLVEAVFYIVGVICLLVLFPLWLLIKGVDLEQWQRRSLASAGAAPAEA